MPALSPAIEVTARALRIDLVTAEVVGALGEAGIRSIVLKGPAIARWLYRDGAPRTYVDSDLLLDPDELARAGEVLRSHGFELTIDDRLAPHADAHHQLWRRGEGSACVELHWRLCGIGTSAHAAWHRLAGDTELGMVGGVAAEFLSPTARALHLALHVDHHGATKPHCLEDLHRGLRLLDHEIWSRARDLARDLEATEAFAAGLRALPEGAAVAARLGVGESARSVAVSMLEAEASARAINLQRALVERGWRGALRVLLEVALPSPAYMRFWDPEAGRSRLALLRAYARRNASLVRDALPVLHEVAQARRRFAQ